jgi:tetratricopeptide (TPR) repeat protein
VFLTAAQAEEMEIEREKEEDRRREEQRQAEEKRRKEEEKRRKEEEEERQRQILENMTPEQKQVYFSLFLSLVCLCLYGNICVCVYNHSECSASDAWQALEEKEKGNEFYKKKQFDEAISHYNRAMELVHIYLSLIHAISCACTCM